MSKPFIFTIALLLTTFLLHACGQKGPLYLPDKDGNPRAPKGKLIKKLP